MRLTFLTHFVLSLAVASAAFFAWRAGILLTVWQNDASMMTSAIAAGLLGSVIWLGWQAWRVGSDRPISRDAYGRFLPQPHTADASFGHLAERALPMLGLFGTAFGLSLQAKALAGGAAAFAPLATSLYCTAAGVLAALIVAVMTFNLEVGLRR